MIIFCILYLLLISTIVYFLLSSQACIRCLYHPIWYTLAIAASFNGVLVFYMIDWTPQLGIAALSPIVALALVYLAAPVMLEPLVKLVRNHRLTNLAALLSFRYRSQLIGSVTGVLLYVAGVTTVAVQLITLKSVLVKLGMQTYHLLGLLILIVGLIGLLDRRFGLFDYTNSRTLVVTLGIHAVFKLACLIVLTGLVLYGVFGSPVGLYDWLAYHPEAVAAWSSPLLTWDWSTGAIFFFFGLVISPQLYQLTLNELANPRELAQARYGVSWYLLPLSIIVPILFWAASARQLIAPDGFLQSLVYQLNQPLAQLMLLIIVLAGVMCTLMVSLVCLPPLLLEYGIRPWRARRRLVQRQDKAPLLHRWVTMLTFLLPVGGLLLPTIALKQLLLILFNGGLVFVPVLLATFFWPRANRQGALLSLVGGALVWISLTAYQVWISPPDISSLSLVRHASPWLVLVTSTLLLVIGSLRVQPSFADQARALECALFDHAPRQRRVQTWRLNIGNYDELLFALSVFIGAEQARRQLYWAMQHCQLNTLSNASSDLACMREQLLLSLAQEQGPTVAQDIIEQVMPYQAVYHSPDAVQTPLPRLSQQAERDAQLADLTQTARATALEKMAAELNLLRRFHHQTLQNLPVGVCTLDNQHRIIGWNIALTRLTGVYEHQVDGLEVQQLPHPWGPLISDFLGNILEPQRRHQVKLDDHIHIMHLQRAEVPHPAGYADQQLEVVVIEDVTDVADMENQIAHQSRLAAIGQLVAGVAHEIGNPVAGIDGLAQNLLADFDDPEIQSSSELIIQQTQRIRDIVNALVGYARTDPLEQGEQQPVALRELSEQAVQLVKLAHRHRLVVDNQIQQEVVVSGYAPQLLQVFINLIQNALDATLDVQPDELEPIRIRLGSQIRSRMVVVDVEDYGSGLPNHDLRGKLFEPFVTTKGFGKGTGLGLSLVQGIITRHRGEIRLLDKEERQQGKGVIAQFSLPLILLTDSVQSANDIQTKMEKS